MIERMLGCVIFIHEVLGMTMIPPVRSLRGEVAGFCLTYMLNEDS